MSNFCSLRVLYLYGNSFCGEVPFFVENTSAFFHNSLKELELDSNNFTGNLSSKLGDIRNLEILSLSNNSFSGPIPESIGRLSLLRSLDIHDNQLNGRILSSLGQLSKLETIDVSNNALDGPVSELHFASLTRLNELLMSSNSLVLNVSSNWVPPFRLQRIDMSSCKLGPKFPHWLQTQRHVELLFMSNANISDTIPEWFEDVFSDTYSLDLDLSYNQISGKLPQFPSDAFKFDLSNNLLSGNIPQIDDNTTLVLYNLLLSNNALTGAIPEYLCKMYHLEVIDLSRNQLSGGIPSCLGNLKWLKVLDLRNNSLEAGNHLKGRIPEKIGNLEQLETLDLSRNKLSGSIPPSLSALHYLSRLNLSFYNLSGQIPKGNQLQTLTDQSIYIGNYGLCGPPLLKSCPGDESDDHKHVGENKNGEKSEFLLFFYAGIGPGFLVGFLGVCGILHFQKSWRYAFFQLVDNIYNRLVVAIELKATWMQRKFRKGEFRE
ncbi:hypothetical protein F0562_032531 [Nyssa sinensis]|uniref:Leucine-rich repeat-containing N-terminal plant-type domain-containing protein n=1 Tax=Nyssa sinensis TaxID=561372 RepID=A0A5J5AQL6_9ASTE|nr:hypothetical protein F0562_032531 [Nyssa sinensis]